MMQACAFEILYQEDQAKCIQKRRERDRLRKQKSRAKAAEITTPLGPAQISKVYIAGKVSSTEQ